MDAQQHQWGAVHSHPQPQHHQPTTVEEVRSLWIGDLQYWVDEAYLHSCFAHTGEVVSVKIIRNKITGHPEGYGFVEFVSHAAAERILQTYNGTQMPGTEQCFRMNWASFGIGERRADAGPEHSIFVGDLSPDVTDYLLQETFRAQYPSVRGAKVVTDPNTGRSKGYGFVKFADETERNRALTEMNGVYCSSRPMRISQATPKKTAATQQQYPTAKVAYQVPTYSIPPAQSFPADTDTNNTTIFVGGLEVNVSEDELRHIFGQFGDLVYVKIPPGRGCGFVQFVARNSAEEALQRLQGTMIGQQVVRLSWGRGPTTQSEQSGAWVQQDPNQWAGAYYGYGQGYDPYSYTAAQDPSLYAYGAYSGYAGYPQQVEGVHDMATMASVVQPLEQKEELFDPLAVPDVNKLNAAYLAVHRDAMLGRPLWLKTSSLS
ncbi:polyadenylate-binding protein RBP47B'-like isoform X2 [Nymphaea colorata]|uniref:polyadenylate-binding protein RBP47B'-like isoform X2 n=1 Tax=Nymphaea colorata TaxID=210225 RepID=UPI00129D9694|nr:polyadenylate-binding protein RBP47B'-like isoform X2 [Nymphaea colorata]